MTEVNFKYKDLICFYINLKFRTDRKERIENELQYIKKLFKYQKIEGCDGNKLDITTYVKNRILPPNPKWEGHDFTEGQLGCMESHLKTWKTFIGTDYKYCLVLEDDAVINKGYFDKMFPKIMSTIDKLDFDWLYLARQSLGHRGFYKGDIVNNIYYIPKTIGSGNQAYIISKQGAKNLLNYFDTPKKFFFNALTFYYPPYPIDFLDMHKKYYKKYTGKFLKIYSIIPIDFHNKRNISLLEKVSSDSKDFLFYVHNWNDSDTSKINKRK